MFANTIGYIGKKYKIQLRCIRFERCQNVPLRQISLEECALNASVVAEIHQYWAMMFNLIAQKMSLVLSFWYLIYLCITLIKKTLFKNILKVWFCGRRRHAPLFSKDNSQQFISLRMRFYTFFIESNVNSTVLRDFNRNIV